jgi:hypothetical protein
LNLFGFPSLYFYFEGTWWRLLQKGVFLILLVRILEKWASVQVAILSDLIVKKHKYAEDNSKVKDTLHGHKINYVLRLYSSVCFLFVKKNICGVKITFQGLMTYINKYKIWMRFIKLHSRTLLEIVQCTRHAQNKKKQVFSNYITCNFCSLHVRQHSKRSFETLAMIPDLTCTNLGKMGLSTSCSFDIYFFVRTPPPLR